MKKKSAKKKFNDKFHILTWIFTTLNPILFNGSGFFFNENFIHLSFFSLFTRPRMNIWAFEYEWDKMKNVISLTEH